MRIIIATEVLTDGSKAYNVTLRDIRDYEIELNAISEEAAEKLAEQLRKTIDLFTVQAVRIIDRR